TGHRGALATLHLLGRAGVEPLHAVARLSVSPRVAEPRAGRARARRVVSPRRRAPRSGHAELDRDRRTSRRGRVLLLAPVRGDAGAAGVARRQPRVGRFTTKTPRHKKKREEKG